VTPAQVAGRLCGAGVDEELNRIRAIVRMGERLSVSAMARTLAYETAITVELALRLMAQAAGRPAEDPERPH
jgi:hypothetical protein